MTYYIKSPVISRSSKSNLLVIKMLNKIKAVDDELIKSVEKIHTPLLNKVMLFMTFLGDGGKVWFLLIAFYWIFTKQSIPSICMLFGLGMGILTAEAIVKRIFCRVRPCHKIEQDRLVLKKMPHFYSFPSSHSCTSFSLVCVSFILCPTWFACITLVIAAGIAFSRFYLQAHYFTDVICGIILGLFCGWLTVKLVFFAAASINPAFVNR